MVVAYPPGGTNDIVTRPIGHKLAELFGQPVAIDNRGGASGNIGTELVAKAPADGYTLLMAAGAVTIAPSIYPRLPYDIVKDFAPVSLAARGGFVLLVHPSVPARTVAELVGLAKSRSTTLNCASAGAGAPPFLAAALFQTMTGIKLTDVPYKGGVQPLADLVGGQVAVMFAGMSTGTPLIQAGKMRAHGVTSRARANFVPNIPTIMEQGVGELKAYEVTSRTVLMAPANTPASIINQLNAEINAALRSPEFREKLASKNLVVPESTQPTAVGVALRREKADWAKVIEAAKIRSD